MIEPAGWRRECWERAPLRVAAKLFAQLAETKLSLHQVGARPSTRMTSCRIRAAVGVGQSVAEAVAKQYAKRGLGTALSRFVRHRRSAGRGRFPDELARGSECIDRQPPLDTCRSLQPAVGSTRATVEQVRGTTHTRECALRRRPLPHVARRRQPHPFRSWLERRPGARSVGGTP